MRLGTIHIPILLSKGRTMETESHSGRAIASTTAAERRKQVDDSSGSKGTDLLRRKENEASEAEARQTIDARHGQDRVDPALAGVYHSDAALFCCLHTSYFRVMTSLAVVMLGEPVRGGGDVPSLAANDPLCSVCESPGSTLCKALSCVAIESMIGIESSGLANRRQVKGHQQVEIGDGRHGDGGVVDTMILGRSAQDMTMTVVTREVLRTCRCTLAKACCTHNCMARTWSEGRAGAIRHITGRCLRGSYGNMEQAVRERMASACVRNASALIAPRTSCYSQQPVTFTAGCRIAARSMHEPYKSLELIACGASDGSICIARPSGADVGEVVCHIPPRACERDGVSSVVAVAAAPNAPWVLAVAHDDGQLSIYHVFVQWKTGVVRAEKQCAAAMVFSDGERMCALCLTRVGTVCYIASTGGHICAMPVIAARSDAKVQRADSLQEAMEISTVCVGGPITGLQVCGSIGHILVTYADPLESGGASRRACIVCTDSVAHTRGTDGLVVFGTNCVWADLGLPFDAERIACHRASTADDCIASVLNGDLTPERVKWAGDVWDALRVHFEAGCAQYKLGRPSKKSTTRATWRQRANGRLAERKLQYNLARVSEATAVLNSTQNVEEKPHESTHFAYANELMKGFTSGSSKDVGAETAVTLSEVMMETGNAPDDSALLPSYSVYHGCSQLGPEVECRVTDQFRRAEIFIVLPIAAEHIAVMINKQSNGKVTHSADSHHMVGYAIYRAAVPPLLKQHIGYRERGTDTKHIPTLSVLPVNVVILPDPGVKKNTSMISQLFSLELTPDGSYMKAHINRSVPSSASMTTVLPSVVFLSIGTYAPCLS